VGKRRQGRHCTDESDGTGYDSAWVTGLSAPKGMGIYKGRLYVADVDEVAVIDIEKQQIVKRIAIDSAGGLNDVTISNKGVVYVSDSRTAKVWRIKNDQPTLYLENLQGVNGLRAVKKDLIIASGKTFLKANKKKKTRPSPNCRRAAMASNLSATAITS
jgi:hypothetical protein